LIQRKREEIKDSGFEDLVERFFELSDKIGNFVPSVVTLMEKNLKEVLGSLVPRLLLT
jgi:hypothetical protein